MSERPQPTHEELRRRIDEVRHEILFGSGPEVPFVGLAALVGSPRAEALDGDGLLLRGVDHLREEGQQEPGGGVGPRADH